MELTYRNRKHITIIALVSLVSVLLLALSFNHNEWGSTSSTGGALEVVTGSQSIVMNHYFLSNNYNKENVKHAGNIGTVVSCALLLLIRFIWRYRIELVFKKRHTLVTLCVRLDE